MDGTQHLNPLIPHHSLTSVLYPTGPAPETVLPHSDTDFGTGAAANAMPNPWDSHHASAPTPPPRRSSRMSSGSAAGANHALYPFLLDRNGDERAGQDAPANCVTSWSFKPATPTLVSSKSPSTQHADTEIASFTRPVPKVRHLMLQRPAAAARVGLTVPQASTTHASVVKTTSFKAPAPTKRYLPPTAAKPLSKDTAAPVKLTLTEPTTPKFSTARFVLAPPCVGSRHLLCLSFCRFIPYQEIVYRKYALSLFPVSPPLLPKARRSRAARRIGMSVLAASMASAAAAAPSRSASATPTRFGRPASAQENKMPSRSSA